MKTITNLNINKLKIRTLSEITVATIDGDKTVSVRLDKEQHRRLKLLALSIDTTMSELVRAFLVQFISQYRKENVVDSEPGKQD